MTNTIKNYTNEELYNFIENEMDLDSENLEEVKTEMELRIELALDTNSTCACLEYTWLNNL